jgi:fructokinase
VTTQKTAPIIIFGEALIDVFPDQKIVGGAPFNVARALGGLACPALFISRIGIDENANLIRNELSKFNLSPLGIQLDAIAPTGQVTVEMTEAEHRFTIRPDQAYDYINECSAKLAIAEIYPQPVPGIIYFGMLAQRNEVSRRSLYALLDASDAQTYLDLNLREGQFTLENIQTSLHYADILKVNEDELQLLLTQFIGAEREVDLPINIDQCQPAITKLIEQFSLQAVIITLGERGYAYVDSDAQILSSQHAPTPPAMIDTVGCGDAFSAIFLAGKILGWPIKLSLDRAQTFASAVCGIKGAVSSDSAFYSAWQERWTGQAAS